MPKRWRKGNKGCICLYLMFGKGVDQHAVDVVDGETESHHNDVLGQGCFKCVTLHQDNSKVAFPC